MYNFVLGKGGGDCVQYVVLGHKLCVQYASQEGTDVLC